MRNRLIAAIALLIVGAWFCSFDSARPVKAQVPMTGAGLGAPSSGGGSATWTATGNPAAQSTFSSSATFSNVAIGSPAASDVIVAVANSRNQNAASLNCNGNAMTLQVQEASVLSGLQLYSITASACGVTGQATTTFVMNSSGTDMREEVLQVGKMTTTTPTPPNTGTVPGNATSISVTVPANGMAVVGGYGCSSASWSGATQDFTTTDDTASVVYMLHTPTTGSVSESGCSTGTIHMIYAAWSP